MTRDELTAMNVMLEDAKRSLRLGNHGRALDSIGEAQAFIVAEIEREDRMWEVIAEEIRHASPEVADDEPVLPALTHDVHLPAQARDEPPSRTP